MQNIEAAKTSGGNFTYGGGDPGGTGTEMSEITITRNIIYDCDHPGGLRNARGHLLDAAAQ